MAPVNEAAAQPTRQGTVLLVDDDDETLALHAEYFRRAGYRVETATNGNEALAKALKVRPDAIVLDLVMPHLDGWETAEFLRAYAPTNGTPLVVCTGLGEEGARTKTWALRGAVFCYKPCPPEAIERAVREARSAGVVQPSV